MMSYNTANAVVFIVFFVSILSIVLYSEYTDLKKAEAGLQECVDTSASTTHVVWQKECK